MQWIVNKGNGLRRNIFQKRISERLDINKICGRFINIRERIKMMMLSRGIKCSYTTNEVRKSKRNFEHKSAQP